MDVPPGFEPFLPIIRDYFIKNYDKYLNRAKELNLKFKPSTTITGRVYGIPGGFQYNYKYIIDKLQEFRDYILVEEFNKLCI